MKLVIVESPTKARTLGRYLGSAYDIQASMGHLVDLPKSKMGVDVENKFEPEYVVVKGMSERVGKLKSKAKKAEIVFLATDPDREGEAISWHIARLLTNGETKETKKKRTKSQAKSNNIEKYQRVTFHEITKTAIEQALAEPHQIDVHLVDAQQARRVVDRLVGYNLSPVLWKKVRRGLSAGRVQSVAVKLIVEREAEINAHKAVEYWEIRVKLNTNSSNGEFWVDLVEIKGTKIAISGQLIEGNEPTKNSVFLTSKAVVEPIVTDLMHASYQIESVERKEQQRRPYPPYTTSTLQQAAANVLGWTGKETMAIAQQLYEQGFITYHRTDSFNIAQEARDKARAYILDTYGKDYVPEKGNFYTTKSKTAQEAHEAIRPSHVKKQSLSEDAQPKQIKLYDLIWKRFIACQMTPAVYDQTAITVKANKRISESANNEYTLRATGKVMKFAGWRAVYNGSPTDSSGDVILPEVKAGESLIFKDVSSEQKFTQPPPRFNDASLVKELEKRGIGRPSTYAPIISTIIARGYVERVERRLQPTPVGQTVTVFLDKNFPDELSYDFTAEMEEDLDRIARGEKEWREVMAAFYTPFAKKVKQVEEKAKREQIPVEETGDICPTCKEGKVVIRSGRFGKFLSCSRFPECKYTASFTQKLEGFVCPQCGGEVVLKRTKKGRSFWGCANYPKCDYASWKDPRVTKVKNE